MGDFADSFYLDCFGKGDMFDPFLFGIHLFLNHCLVGHMCGTLFPQSDPPTWRIIPGHVSIVNKRGSFSSSGALSKWPYKWLINEGLYPNCLHPLG